MTRCFIGNGVGTTGRRMLALVVVSALTACATPPGDRIHGALPQAGASAVSLDSAAHLLAKGDIQGAYARYSKLALQNPDDAAAQLGLGETLLASGRPSVALDAYRQAETDPDLRAQALQGQGLALWHMGDVEEARVRLAAAVEADPELWRAWNALAAVHDVQENWPAAGDAYARALALRPMDAMLHNNVGASLLLQDRLPEAIVAFQEAIRLDPALDTAQNNLRLALALQGRYADAIDGADDRQRAIALNNAGYVALTQGDLQRAESYFREALRLSPTYYVKAAQNLERLPPPAK